MSVVEVCVSPFSRKCVCKGPNGAGALVTSSEEVLGPGTPSRYSDRSICTPEVSEYTQSRNRGLGTGASEQVHRAGPPNRSSEQVLRTGPPNRSSEETEMNQTDAKCLMFSWKQTELENIFGDEITETTTHTVSQHAHSAREPR
jgi:hypothetical protein